jgi:deoxyribonucleoside regulator
MLKDTPIETMVKVSKLYYEEEMTQQQIASILNVSRTTIVNILNEARKQNIVQIKVVNPLQNLHELESLLCQRYDLLDAFVIPDYTDYSFHLREMGNAAAQMLLKNVFSGDLIGVGWGKNVLETVKSLPYEHLNNNLEWIPLVGELDYTKPAFQTNEIAKMCQEKLGGIFFPLTFPAVVDNLSIREVIMTDKSTQLIRKKWENLNILLLGIGVPQSNSAVKRIIDNREVLTQNAVGEFVANCYDKDGNYYAIESNAVRIGIPFDLLKKPRVRIGIAAEKDKWEAIKVAINTGIINIIVTNQGTAEYLLSE